MAEDVPLISIKSLQVFEAAARNKSFTRAATELGITQPAVSFAIKNLEAGMGLQLFTRASKGIQLTSTGRALSERLTLGFGIINQVVQDMAQLQNAHQITLAVSTAVATWWLLPRIARFKRQHPEIDLRVITTDTDIDLMSQNVDLAITLGAGSFDDYRKWTFAEEEIFPVCSQAYLKKTPQAASLEAYPTLQLIHLEQKYRPRLSWKEWLGHFGVEELRARPSLQFSDYSIVLQAAIDGQGIAQGWRHIVDPLIAQNLLVRPVQQSVRTQNPMYIIASKERELRRDVLMVKDWLLEESLGVSFTRRH